MTNIHFPVDGLGTQSLKKQNKADKKAFHVDATLPDSKNKNQNSEKRKDTPEKNQSQNSRIEPTNEDQTKTLTQVATERRHGKRRQKNSATLLNTRSEQDRRKNPDKNSNNEVSQCGIDTEA